MTYSGLYHKFKDKGYNCEFTLLVVPTPIVFQSSVYPYFTEEEQKEIRRKSTQEAYGKEWDSWSTWIDHQQYKF